MTSANEKVNQLHAAYCDSTGYELALNFVLERQWLQSIEWGIEADDIKLVVKYRMAGIAKGDRKPACIFPRNICGSEEALAQVMEELAAIKAKLRVKVLPSGKQDVLRATGRSPEVETDPAILIRNHELIQKLKAAAG